MNRRDFMGVSLAAAGLVVSSRAALPEAAPIAQPGLPGTVTIQGGQHVDVNDPEFQQFLTKVIGETRPIEIRRML